METANRKANMFSTHDSDDAARAWDSESHASPYSTVAGADCDTYCEHCDSDIVEDPTTRDGFRCNCDDPANQPGVAPACGFCGSTGMIYEGATVTVCVECGRVPVQP